MWKFLIALITGNEVCEKCLLLKEQLEYERSQNKELIDTLTSQLKPQTIFNASDNAKELKPIHNKFRTFSRRRDELEREARDRAAKLNSPLAGKSDEERESVDIDNKSKTNPIVSTGLVQQLEMELGIQSEPSEAR